MIHIVYLLNCCESILFAARASWIVFQDGWTALLRASARGEIDEMKKLILLGANVFAMTNVIDHTSLLLIYVSICVFVLITFY